MTGKYDDLNKTQLIELLEKHDRTKKLGLVWERDEIDADKALDHDFIVAPIDEDLSDKPAPWDNLIIEGDNYDALRWLRTFRFTFLRRSRAWRSTIPTTLATRFPIDSMTPRAS